MKFSFQHPSNDTFRRANLLMYLVTDAAEFDLYGEVA